MISGANTLCESDLPMQLELMGSYEPLGRVQMSRCTTLVESIGEALETITFYVFWTRMEISWSVATIYN